MSDWNSRKIVISQISWVPYILVDFIDHVAKLQWENNDFPIIHVVNWNHKRVSQVPKNIVDYFCYFYYVYKNYWPCFARKASVYEVDLTLHGKLQNLDTVQL